MPLLHEPLLAFLKVKASAEKPLLPLSEGPCEFESYIEEGWGKKKKGALLEEGVRRTICDSTV